MSKSVPHMNFLEDDPTFLARSISQSVAFGNGGSSSRGNRSTSRWQGAQVERLHWCRWEFLEGAELAPILRELRNLWKRPPEHVHLYQKCWTVGPFEFRCPSIANHHLQRAGIGGNAVRVWCVSGMRQIQDWSETRDARLMSRLADHERVLFTEWTLCRFAILRAPCQFPHRFFAMLQGSKFSVMLRGWS